MISIGIDLGINGGMCALEKGKLPFLIPMPTKRIKDANIYDWDEISRWIKDVHTTYKQHNIVLVMEDINFYGDSKIKAVKHLQIAHGFISGIAFMLGIRVIAVHPNTWQKRLEINKISGKDKKGFLKGKTLEECKKWEKENGIKAQNLKKAKELFPTLSFIPLGCRAVHDGIVDATLLAVYGIKLLQGRFNNE